MSTKTKVIRNRYLLNKLITTYKSKIIKTAIGAIIGIIGFILLVGKVSGWWPTFPYAGFITMGLGGLIMKISEDE